MHYPIVCFPILLDTQLSVTERFFDSLISRDDIGIILINQHVRFFTWSYECAFIVNCLFQVANDIRHKLKDYTKTIPTVLEIPSKNSP
jgi:V-type H+-transporting ATPase subunit F